MILTQLMRHIANLGLLLAFTTLAVTGVMSFVLPFSITTARVHIVFGLVTLVLVGMHLATRVSYFTRIAKQSVDFKAKKKPQVPRWLVASIAIVWGGLLAASFYGTKPASNLIAVGYEARHTAEIFRASPQTAHEQIGPSIRVATLSAESGEVLIDVSVTYREDLIKQPAAAIWAQSTGVPGRMIETLYVDKALAYSATPTWNGKAVPRHHILPLWRHQYSDVNGVDPNGDIDAVTSATPDHSFSIEQSLTSEDDEIVICLEFNAAGDTNEAYPDEHVGQPSVLYTALVDLSSDQRYYLMTRTAHGGGAEIDGQARYGFEEITTANHVIEKVLVQIKRPQDKK
ncbi:MAG: DUF4405 domain-containing protein [Phycisphaeraceae bacterium]